MCSGIWTWITSAPQSASWRAAVGPARTCVMSITRKRARACEAGRWGIALAYKKPTRGGVREKERRFPFRGGRPGRRRDGGFCRELPLVVAGGPHDARSAREQRELPQQPDEQRLRHAHAARQGLQDEAVARDLVGEHGADQVDR